MVASSARRSSRFLLVAAVLAVIYAAAVPALWFTRGVVVDGPLSFRTPALKDPLTPEHSLAEVEERCQSQQALTSVSYERIKIVGGSVDGHLLYACYGTGINGAVVAAVVLDQDLFQVKDVGLLKRSGAWRWIGAVKTPFEAILGFLGLIAILVMYFRYYQKPRPAPPPSTGKRWWQGRAADIGAWFLPVLGWIAIWALPGRTRPRKIRLSFLYTFAYIPFFVVGVFASVTDYPDPLSIAVVGILSVGLVWGWLGGWALVRAEGWGYPDGSPGMQAAVSQPWSPASVAPSGPTAAFPTAVRPVSGDQTYLEGASSASGMFKVQAPSQLPTFADVGGMTSLKELLAETFGLLLSFGDEAESYRITFNGILLHGEPGLGKTFIGKATAGEFALNFLHVTTGQLVSKWLGESAKNIAEAFRVAAANVPCLLFFDEFDSVARRRDDDPDNESRRVVNQLLTSLEEYRTVRELVVMAATNRLEQLDPAVVRPGRFDRHIRVDLPDREARLAILAAQLQRRPTAAGLDLNLLADRTEGLTPATLASIVESAALAAFREATAVGGQIVPITTELLLAAFTARQGKDRPAASTYSWDDLVLDQRTKLELQQIQRLIEDPELPRRLGIDPPSGLLLAGLPGTGKTTIARVLAAQAHCSFYAVSAADLTSKWVGESEQRIQSLFSRARDNSPSIVFLDELDAIARKRLGGHDAYDRQLTQLLTEIDGLGSRPGVFVIGATNRPDMLDPAITRGGRLSRTILIPMPNYDARLSILGIHTRRMPLAAVDLQTVARATEGFSGGDLEAVCQQAAIQALVRAGASDVRSRTGESLEVLLEDFAAAVSAIRTTKMFGSVSQPRNG